MDRQRRRFLQGTAMALGASTVSAGSAAADDYSPQLDTAIDPDDVSTARSADGMVASAHTEATEVGVEILESGGNAIDAAAAVQLALDVVEPYNSGLGGGAYVMVYSADRDAVFTMDGFNPLPAAAHPELYTDDLGDPLPYEAVAETGLSAGVPGTVRLLDIALKRFGSKYFDEITQPAVELAEDGFEVDAVLENRIETSIDKFNEAAKEVYCENGEPLNEGDHLVQEDLADTHRLIRDGGSDPFYQGEIGEALANTVQDYDGVMTFGDLNRFSVNINQPLWVEYDDYQLALQPSSSWGGTAVGMTLKLLEPFDIGQLDSRSTDKYHYFIEAYYIVTSAMYEYFADEQFVDIPYQGLFSDDYLQELRDSFDPDQATPPEELDPRDPWAYQPGGAYRTSAHTDLTEHPSTDERGRQSGSAGSDSTTHFVVADSDGNIVTIGSTLAHGFGTGIMVPGYGIMINNTHHLMDFTPGGIHEVQPHKYRPSGMCPTIVFENGEPLLTLGAAGGAAIPAATSQVILNVLEYGMDLPAAYAEPRVQGDVIENEGAPPLDEREVSLEPGVPEDAADELAERGHRLDIDSNYIAALQALMIEDGEYVGVGSYRRDGHAEGL
jgi:gamma-glutamyltranspeptidase/glutathione hydrolase